MRRSKKSEIDVVREQVEQAELQLELSTLKRLQESLDISDRWVGNKDVDDELWLAIGEGPGGTRTTGFDTEAQLAEARRTSRELVETNEYAINTIENRISYVVGSGLQAKITTKQNSEEEIPKPDLLAAQDALNDWLKRSGWLSIHEERQRRLDRDGEVFLRIFDIANDPILRVVEPSQVYQPTNLTGEQYSFGVENSLGDVENVVAYWINEKRVDASEVIHIKINVDRNVKRGKPTLWPLRHAYRSAAKLRRNMTSVTAAQATIAWIRKHKNMPASAIQAFAANATAAKLINPVTGATTRYKHAPGPTVMDVSDATTYEFPAVGMNAGNMVAVLQAELRAIAAALVMPEYMLSSDASNSNMASTIMAGTPADRNFKRLQQIWVVADEAFLNDRILPKLFEAGLIDAALAGRIEVMVEAPEVSSRDRVNETRASQIEHQEGVLSRKTWATRAGYDWETEEANLAIEREQAIEDAQSFGLPTGQDQGQQADQGDNPDQSGNKAQSDQGDNNGG